MIYLGKTKLDAKITGKVGWEMDINGHRFVTDAAVETGGEDQGPRPKVMLLASLIGCTGIDVKMILDKMKVDLQDMNISVEAEAAEDHPKVYTDIHLTFTFKGKDLPMDKLQKAVKLSQERYCGVTAMLQKAAPITYDIVVEE
ncbi:MAG: OsmC family protein [Bacillota bacterium]